MKPAYRIPLGKFPMVARFISQETAANTPITEMVVNSLITSHADGANGRRPAPTVGGIAWDGGYGIRTRRGLDRRRQDLDGGDARRGSRHASRSAPGASPLDGARASVTVMARASNAIGQTQTRGARSTIRPAITTTSFTASR